MSTPLPLGPPRPMSIPRLLGRGLTLRCARCGGGGLFRRWTVMVETCPQCGLHFEREQGYWLGAMMINLAATEAVFVALFLGMLIATWPDVPWTAVVVAVVTVNLVFPILFYPVSKTLWVAIERRARKWAD